MEETQNLKDDLIVLRDMYPELTMEIPDLDVLDDDPTLKEVTIALNFDIQLPQGDITIEYNDKSLTLSKLTDNLASFTIDRAEYPNFKTAITLDIESLWMEENDKMKIMEALHREFDDMTDPESSTYNPYTPVLMLVLDYLVNDTSMLLFPNDRRVCATEKSYAAFELVSQRIKEEELKRMKRDCSICMETKRGDEMVRLPCNRGHFLCKKCIVEYYGTMIEEGRIVNVRCPECDFKEIDLNKFKSYSEMKAALFTPAIPFSFFKGLLPDRLCVRYEELFYSQTATKLSKHSPYACVTCRRCDRWCIKDDLDDPLMRCDRCEFTFCFDCLHSWHGYNNKCGSKVRIPIEVLEEYLEDKDIYGDSKSEKMLSIETKYGKRALELEINDYIAEKLLDLAIAQEGSDLQRCPKCRCVVQRSEGCNRMKCGVCGALFCYLCGISLFVDDCYQHFRDPRSDCYGRLFEGMPGAD